MNYKLPYDYILSFLYPIRPKVRKRLGCYGLLHENKILMLLRDRQNQPEFNGVFVATEPKFYDELTKELHSSNMEFDMDGEHHTWIFISEDLEHFEDILKQVGEMIKKGDVRIGKQDRPAIS